MVSPCVFERREVMLSFKDLNERQRYRYFDLLDALRPDGELALVKYYGNHAPVVARALRDAWPIGYRRLPVMAQDGWSLMAIPWVAAFVFEGEK
jgi:hypothetical protein